MITWKFRADGNELYPGKEWRLRIYVPSSLGGRPISVGRQWVRWKFLQLDNFNSVNSKASLSYLNRFMVLIATVGGKRFMACIWRKCYCKVVYWAVSLEAIVFLVDSYY